MITMTELALPALHICEEIRVIRSEEKLRFMRGYSLPPIDAKNFYWDWNSNWFQAVQIQKLKNAPPLMRFFGPSDLMVAEFKLEPIEQPFTQVHLYREIAVCASMTMDKKAYKAAKDALRNCCTSREVIEWFDKEANIHTRY